MQSPRQSLGERKMQPNTPCSASGEFGGSRSTERAKVSPLLLGRRRAGFFRSGASRVCSLIGVRAFSPGSDNGINTRVQKHALLSRVSPVRFKRGLLEIVQRLSTICKAAQDRRTPE